MALFDTYVMVDWSANSVPKRGADSIWYAVIDRHDRGLRRRALENPSTRHAALAGLTDLLRVDVAHGCRVLVGFDFPNAYPEGFAAAAGFAGTPWRAVWDGLTALITDAPDNANNRFAVAAELNRRICAGPGPFWACPPRQAGPTLTPKKPPTTGRVLPDRRLCESYLRSTQPCWKLYTTGSVGSQALMGIPVQVALRDHADLAPVTRIWPFETGLTGSPDLDGIAVVIAEVYPSILPVRPKDGEVKDALQVETTARAFATRDDRGLMTADLAGPAELTPAQRDLIEREEGWILGAGTFDGRAWTG
jgi:hypothetical protein